MRRLDDFDVAALLDVVHEAAAVDGPEPFPRPILQLLADLVPLDGYVHYFETDLVTRHSEILSSDRRFRSTPPALASLAKQLAREGWPFSSYRGHNGIVLRLSDLFSRRELTRTKFYNELMRPFGEEYYMRAWLRTPRTFAACFEFVRRARDFSSRDRHVLELLVPHLTLCRERALARTRPAPAELGLTPREKEILHWVATGRTNAQIAALLYVSPGTVRTHLENLYEKLGVHTRTAAVTRAFGFAAMTGGGPEPATRRGPSIVEG